MQNKVITFLDELSDDALKKEATSEAKSDTFSVIMKVSTHAHHAPGLSATRHAMPLVVIGGEMREREGGVVEARPDQIYLHFVARSLVFFFRTRL